MGRLFAQGWMDRVEALLALLRGSVAAVAASLLSSAEITLTANATATVMVNQNQFFLLAGAWGSDLTPHGFSTALPAGTITCLRAGRYKTLATIGFTSPAGTNTLRFQVFKNGAAIPDHTAITWTDTNAFPNTVTLTGIDDVAVGDVLDLRVECTTAPGVSVVVTERNFAVGV